MNNVHMFANMAIADGTSSSPVGPGYLNRRMAEMLDELDDLRTREMSMSVPEIDTALELAGRLKAWVTSYMCDLTRNRAGADLVGDAVEVLRRRGRLPGREAKRMAKVAQQLSEMPKVAERFASGDITLGHASALANAAEKVGPEAVEADAALLESADEMLPDTFVREARDWTNRKLIEQGVNLLERQKRAREANLWVEKDNGMGMLFAKLQPSRFGHIRQAVDTRYMQLLRQDGVDGRDPDEVRTPKQRRADVVFELLTNRDPDTGEFLTEHVGVGAKASTQVVILAETGVIDGTNPGGRCEIIGVGPVPRQILQTLSPDTELSGMVFDRAGRVLWLGRNQRLANAPGKECILRRHQEHKDHRRSGWRVINTKASSLG